ncbi:MAG: PilZ domain-containing protein [Candidatus Omnitrophota bacterium]
MPEKRQYVRMNTVFPVEFEILPTNGRQAVSKLLQGFTRDVSAGGMCIELKSFGRETEKLLQDSGANLHLVINPTFSKHPIQARARVAWLKREETTSLTKFLIGVSYTEIDSRARGRLIGYAKRLIWIPRATAAAVVGVVALSAGLFIHNQKLLMENRRLVHQLVQSAEKKSGVASDLYLLQKRKTDLDRELSKAQENIKRLEAAISSLTAENTNQKNAYEDELKEIIERQENIGVELRDIREGREKLRATYETLEESEKLTASAALRQMYGWLKSHQNLHTGLVASFEGDPSLEDWAFTYDQSLASQTFLVFGDVKNAETILSFYDQRAQREKGAFYNTYDTVSGDPVESIIHAGPNIWMGIAALQYQHRVQDGRFVPLARSIADWVIGAMQDAEGGIRGGPTVAWYSTEHNLDAYAFFTMLHEVSGDAKYRQAAEKVLAWIKKYSYSAEEKRMNRGKGDATIATDTFSWAIAALGPGKLREIEFDPEAIMDFAEQHCEVSVNYQQAGGKAGEARGFDFAKAENIGRGGVISTEWTGQVIVTYQILSKYFNASGDTEKAALYADKANFYLNELQKLIITSPSRTGQGRGCLPYASVDNVDTGHGWRTPKGRRTGSVAATAYGIFAWIGYNPFNLNDQKSVS